MSEDTAEENANWVGPVLQAGVITQAVIQAILVLNPGTKLVDRGSYVRVLSPARCRLDPRVVQSFLGAPFELPKDLERIMPSFQGELAFEGGEATWESRRRQA